jgi:hypothetical protein
MEILIGQDFDEHRLIGAQFLLARLEETLRILNLGVT